MYNQIEAEKKERRKIIAVATIAVAIILALIAAIVVVATKKTGHNETSNEETTTSQTNNAEAKDENKEEDKKETEDKKTESATETNDNPMMGSAATEPKNETPVATTSSAMPSTGPEDFLPVALMAGVLVAYLSSFTLAKREK